ncbi:hypothetical protein VTH82DRAFT_7040 [Thermothelomyces myriococcoides]
MHMNIGGDDIQFSVRVAPSWLRMPVVFRQCHATATANSGLWGVVKGYSAWRNRGHTTPYNWAREEHGARTCGRVFMPWTV